MSRHMSPPAQLTTVYHLKIRWPLLISGLLIVGGGSYYGIRIGDPFLILALLLYAVYVFVLAQVLRIVVSPDGIAYHNSGFYTIQSSWLNVDRIVTVSTLMGNVRCLKLRFLSARGWTGVTWLFSAPERGRTIPLSGGWARSEQLEQQIRQYAPHLND